VFSVEDGWRYGEIKDSDPTVFDKEKEIGGPHPVRLSNILVTELAKERGVTSFIVDLPHVCQ
jgi:butyrate kinase